MQEFIDVIKVLLVMFIVTAMVWLAAYAVWLAYTVVKDKVKRLKDKYDDETI